MRAMDVRSHPQAGDNAPPPQAILDYYSSPTHDVNLEAKFSNIDDLNNYEKCIKKLGIPETKNFVTDVWSDSAWCAVDLGADEIRSLLTAKRPPRYNGHWIETRWINFWGGDLQQDAVGAVAAHYGLT